MNGITYYRLQSDYDGDVTNNCGLTGQQIDNNFYVLEGRDVKSLEVEGDDITIILYNGDRITADGALSGYAKDLSFDFDKENGTLTITQNGEATVIDGFGCDSCGVVYTDQTLVGDGTKDNPLGISDMAQTGHYKPVNGIVDLTGDEKDMPENPNVGDRYIVRNEISNYGRLYNYCGVKHISCLLGKKNSEWRVPKMSDWNEMLNALEPSAEDRNHDAKNPMGYPYSSTFLGKYAGKFIKDDCGWDECDNSSDAGCDCGEGTSTDCNDNTNPCMPNFDCHHEQLEPSDVGSESVEPYDCYGIDFNAIPLGYADFAEGVHLSGKRAYFWTGLNKGNEAFAKAIDYCKNGVYQELVSKDNYMSLRLVKDFNGSNFYGQESVLDQVVTTSLVPYLDENGETHYRVWTTVNIDIDTPCGDIKPSLDSDCEDTSVVYSIAEWNGHNWIYKRLEEGETVTVLCDEPDCDYVDYILVHGELVEKGGSYDGDIDELKDDIRVINSIVDEIDSIIGDYASDKGTIAERLDAIEMRLSNMMDFNDRNNDNELEPDEPYDKDEDGGGDGIKVGEKDGEDIYW